VCHRDVVFDTKKQIKFELFSNCERSAFTINKQKDFLMSTTADFIEYVCVQISGAGNIRHRKMFGEYMVYINDKPVLLVCDNTVFVKMLPCIENLMENSSKGFPYPGAKEHYILDIDNAMLAKDAAHILEQNTPLPKPKIKKKTAKPGKK